jgi:hypothetical protein
MAEEDVPTQWIATEITHGRFSVENGQYRIEIFADFSGQLTDNRDGSVVAFPDLRVLIDASKLLEEALVDYYGGYK